MEKLKIDFNTCVNTCDIYDMACHEGCSSSYQYGLETCPCRSMCPDGCNYGVGVGKFQVDILIGSFLIILLFIHMEFYRTLQPGKIDPVKTNLKISS